VKVVLFCGGMGMRIRDYSESVPKPMVPIGYRPILWHVMKYYAHFGLTDFVLCLGYKPEMIKHFFLTYNEAMANDFVLSEGGAKVHLLKTDIHNWNITFVDTGLHSSIGERLRAVRHLLRDDELFLANYGDVLTDAPLDAVVDRVLATPDLVGSLLAVPPEGSFHVVQSGADDRVTGFTPAADLDLRINGGYFVLRQSIFDFLSEGDDLVMDGCTRAAAEGRLLAVPYDGFWAPMDTLKERSLLEDLWRTGACPWAVWRHDRSAGGGGGGADGGGADEVARPRAQGRPPLEVPDLNGRA
jgi:glucose-1-phosphate cytidylyltransferase